MLTYQLAFSLTYRLLLIIYKLFMITYQLAFNPMILEVDRRVSTSKRLGV